MVIVISIVINNWHVAPPQEMPERGGGGGGGVFDSSFVFCFTLAPVQDAFYNG